MRRIAVEGEDHRLVGGEQFVEILVFQAVRMLGLRLQHHQIDHVDDADADVGDVARSSVTAASVSSVGTSPAQAITTSGSPSSLLAQCQMPAPAVQWRRRVDVEPLPLRLLAGDDQVDVVAAAQAVIGHRQQAVGVGRQIDAHDVGLLVGDMIDEAGILMREAVVILPPDMRGQQIVQRRDRLAPGDVRLTFSHLACWLNIESMMWMKAS
jgi:hypothetical protein